MSVNDDDKALQKFNDTVRFEDGRYQVTWPWKEEYPSLPTNYELAMGRLRSLVNRLTRNPECKLELAYRAQRFQVSAQAARFTKKKHME